MRKLAPLLILVTLSACGPEGAVWVRVEAPLRVPEDCDTLSVVARGTADGSERFSERHDLVALGAKFPIEFALSTDERSHLGAGALEVEVQALRADALAAPWAQAKGSVDLVERQWTELRLSLCDCPK